MITLIFIVITPIMIDFTDKIQTGDCKLLSANCQLAIDYPATRIPRPIESAPGALRLIALLYRQS